MKNMVAATVPVMALAVSGAIAEPLSGETLRERIVGRTVHLATPYGVELPLRYEASGEVSGNISGFSIAGMFAPRETGTWWVDGSNLCQQWPTWYDAEVFCFTVENTGEDTIAWVRDDGMAGTARIED